MDGHEPWSRDQCLLCPSQKLTPGVLRPLCHALYHLSSPMWLQPSSRFAVVGFHILFSSLPPRIIKKHQTAKHTDTNLTDKSLTQRSTMRQHLLISRSSDPSVSNSGDLGVPTNKPRCYAQITGAPISLWSQFQCKHKGVFINELMSENSHCHHHSGSEVKASSLGCRLFIVVTARLGNFHTGHQVNIFKIAFLV